MITDEELKQRFMDKVYIEPNSGCWLWEGATTVGYGSFYKDRKSNLAHRVSYEMFVGEIPNSDSYHGMCVLHKCDIPSCVNPDHLFIGTQADNMHNMISKERSGSIGSDSNFAKLNEFQIRVIKRLLSFNTMKQHEIGRLFEVHQCAISRIKNKKRWSHIEIKEEYQCLQF